MKSKAAVLLLLLLTAGSNLQAQTRNTGTVKENPLSVENKDVIEEKDIIEKNTEAEKIDTAATTRFRNILALWGEGRLRYEVQDNFNSQFYGNRSTLLNMRDPANTFLMGKGLAGFTFTPLQFITLSMGALYANVWGSAISEPDYFNPEFGREDNTDRENPEPYNCFLQITDPLIRTVTVKAGRQLLTYGDGRIFSAGEWSNTTRWLWDAAKISFKYQNHFMDAYYGRTVVHEPDELSIKHDDSGYKSYGFYGHFQFSILFKEIGIEPFALTKKNKSNTIIYNDKTYHSYAGERTPEMTEISYGDLESYYFGARIYGKDLYGFEVDYTYVKENGKYSTDKIDACAYHGMVGYYFKSVSVKPRLRIKYNYASGDRNNEDGIHGTFDGAFTDTTLFGKMGLFTWRNIRDYQINFSVQPLDVLSFAMAYHRLKLAEAEDHWYLAETRTLWYESSNSRSIYGKWGTDLGHMIEVMLKIQVIKNSTVEFGFARLISGHFVKSLPNTNDNKHYANLFYFQWESKIDYSVF